MAGQFDKNQKRAIKAALAGEAYRTNRVRIADPGLAGTDWLVASHRGLFAVGQGVVRTVVHGWFFGLCRAGDHLYLFENCAMRDRSRALGRIIRLSIAGGRLGDPKVLVTGLDANCHQLVVIDGDLWLVDTANQCLRRYTLNGEAIDVIAPFAPAPASDRSGAYLHINGVAKVGGRLAVMLHNGKAVPDKHSELAWLDADHAVVERQTLDGHRCHDIVEDDEGVLWHSASMTGEMMASDGRRAKVGDDLMTRGIAFTADRIMVGLSSFGARKVRDGLLGSAVILDRDLNILERYELPGPPTDIVAV